MEEETLTIKTIPYEGEAFSSFLLRTAVRNRIRYEQLLKISEIKNSRSPHIDLNPKVVTDLRKLSLLLQIDKKYFKGASLENIIKTFLDEEDQNANYYRSFILNVFNHTYRCFCPMCLKEKNCYQLLWQIKELKVCDKHGTPLTSQCPSCKQNQPYVHPSLVEVECYSCGEKLFKQDSPDSALNTNYYNAQIKKYEIWRTLLTLETKLNPIGVEDKSKYLTLLILYYYNQREDDFYMSRLKTLSNDTKSRFLSYIQKGEGYKATLPQILKVIEESGATISEFINTKLPEKFINSVQKYQAQSKKIPVCQSPWCSSYQTSTTMIRSKKSNMTWNGLQYDHVHRCSVCYVKYGFIKNTEKPNKLKRVSKGILDGAAMRLSAETYINNQIAKDEIIADIYLYKYLDSTKKTVKKLFPELLEWIEEQKQLQKARMNDKVEEERIERIKEAVILITNQGDYPTYENVVEISGVPKKYIRTHKKVSNVFNELKKRYRRK